ncbi:MAG: transglycosylase domain-containing protein [Flavobacteriales bacterium]|jgi:hypothetical protein|nr:transglycosylase domain-containing protein [Flavobacteriales bacterium]
MINVFKYLGILILSVLISITVLYQYKKSNIYSELETDGYFELVNQPQNIPQNIINTYNEVYPETAESILIPRYDCPCRNLIYFKYCNRNRLDYYIATRIIKNEIGRNQCIKIHLNNFDFLYNCIGIQKASKFYFNSDLNKLSKENMTKLILMVKNPTSYNPKRNPEKLNQAYNKYINDL